MGSIRPLVVIALAHGAFAALFGDFTLDDAYITYRYSENWVAYGEIVWNPGEDPVEGFTSFLWMALLAGAGATGLSIEGASKVLGLSSSFATLALLHREALRARLDEPTRVALLGVIGASPGFAVLATQGMETALAALILLLSALALHRAIEGSRPAAWAYFGLGTLGLLARPDAFPFLAAATLVALGALVAARETAIARAAWIPAGVFAVIGAAYFHARAQYFGHWLPNPFYIKGDGAFAVSGALYVARFVALVVVPLGAYLLWRIGSASAVREAVRGRPALLALAVGAATFVAYFVSVRPIQGAMYRYLFPIVPVLLFAGIGWLRASSARISPGRAWGAVAVLALFGLHTLPDALENRALRSSADRVALARALARFDGRTLLTTEAGALPYFSGWRSFDVLGLNSEEIAHDGLTLDLLDRIDPDVIMMLNFVERVASDHAGYRQTADFIERRGYVEVARVRKNARATHSYFLRAADAAASPLREAILGVRGIEYVPLAGGPAAKRPTTPGPSSGSVRSARLRARALEKSAPGDPAGG